MHQNIYHQIQVSPVALVSFEFCHFNTSHPPFPMDMYTYVAFATPAPPEERDLKPPQPVSKGKRRGRPMKNSVGGHKKVLESNFIPSTSAEKMTPYQRSNEPEDGNHHSTVQHNATFMYNATDSGQHYNNGGNGEVNPTYSSEFQGLQIRDDGDEDSSGSDDDDDDAAHETVGPSTSSGTANSNIWESLTEMNYNHSDRARSTMKRHRKRRMHILSGDYTECSKCSKLFRKHAKENLICGCCCQKMREELERENKARLDSVKNIKIQSQKKTESALAEDRQILRPYFALGVGCNPLLSATDSEIDTWVDKDNCICGLYDALAPMVQTLKEAEQVSCWARLQRLRMQSSKTDAWRAFKEKSTLREAP
ncbi:hypothetical protein CONPUDRAFT_73843 [Coniophora puteana RWD-64-598 SS2]|uniref:Uncharacterized protein n=1 Tax=Coniophora puteana (strain RWD-64-598) TaxID=741705 RepID=A0A5M3MQ19_CONPW|nr:uncharacterized protein CONPUDRAFT_73843 [Coniophora puteana RWD-64-598 SS2]EIW80814.1 hypothetical protein CONPUDRAFT_73843 [Coniophora puteana RWD-64-598 SS2]